MTGGGASTQLKVALREQRETTLAETTRLDVRARQAAWGDPRDQGGGAGRIPRSGARPAGVGHRSGPALLRRRSLLDPERSRTGRSGS